MKKLLVVTMGIALLTLPMTALAGVEGSDHDMSAGDDKLCNACHIPHNALGDKLWSSTPSGTYTGVQDLCYTCHDGVIVVTGYATAMNTSLEQHLPVGDCSGDGACHDVHNQNVNVTGKFVVVAETNGSYCETCHDASMFTGAEGYGDHTAGITHFTNGGTFTCNQCHTVHGATAQTTNPIGLTNPILLADNQPGAYYGAFCISCHNGIAPPVAVAGSGGVAATDNFDYAEATNDGSETKHPTINTGGANPVGGCNKCHTVHDPAGTDVNGYILMADNTNSAYCVSCHAASGAPSVGGNSHWIGAPASSDMNSGLSPALPWANQIDEDGNAGFDYGSATTEMVCQTCHSVHRSGSVTSNNLLRDDNGNLNEICSACHKDN